MRHHAILSRSPYPGSKMSSRIWLLALGLPNVVWAAALDSDGGGLPDHVESELGTDASDPGDDELCGDGVVVGGEECDDGNTDDHDGCDSLCVISAGYTCWSRDLNLQVKNPGWETPDGGNQINTLPTSWTLESGSVDHYQWTHYHYSADNYAVDMAGSPGIGVVYKTWPPPPERPTVSRTCSLRTPSRAAPRRRSW